MSIEMVAFSQFASLSAGSVFVEIQNDYGYVVLVGVASGFLLAWQAIQVGKMRNKLKIPYPLTYSPETTGDGQLFNCYQRAHQNTLESYPFFLMCLFTGGLLHPIPSAVAGTIWIAGRVGYSLGYYTGDPEKRGNGNIISYLGLLALVGSSSMFGAKLLGCHF